MSFLWFIIVMGYIGQLVAHPIMLKSDASQYDSSADFMVNWLMPYYWLFKAIKALSKEE